MYCINVADCITHRDCINDVSIQDDGWTEHQCFDLSSCLVDMYDTTTLHNIIFSRLQFDNAANFWIDEFILVTGLGNYKGENI